MPFDASAKTTFNKEAALVDLIDLDDDKKPLEVAYAVFSDGSQVAFPAGCRFPPDNHMDGDTVKQLRVRVTPPPSSKGPSILMPLGCSREYVETVIRRIEQGV